MSITQNTNNEMAFPVCTGEVYESGMSLKDYFAAKALQANADNDDQSLEEIVETCYALADAMLLERNK